MRLRRPFLACLALVYAVLAASCSDTSPSESLSEQAPVEAASAVPTSPPIEPISEPTPPPAPTVESEPAPTSVPAPTSTSAPTPTEEPEPSAADDAERSSGKEPLGREPTVADLLPVTNELELSPAWLPTWDGTEPALGLDCGDPVVPDSVVDSEGRLYVEFEDAMQTSQRAVAYEFSDRDQAHLFFEEIVTKLATCVPNSGARTSDPERSDALAVEIASITRSGAVLVGSPVVYDETTTALVGDRFVVVAANIGAARSLWSERVHAKLRTAIILRLQAAVEQAVYTPYLHTEPDPRRDMMNLLLSMSDGEENWAVVALAETRVPGFASACLDENGTAFQDPRDGGSYEITAASSPRSVVFPQGFVSLTLTDVGSYDRTAFENDFVSWHKACLSERTDWDPAQSELRTLASGDSVYVTYSFGVNSLHAAPAIFVTAPFGDLVLSVNVFGREISTDQAEELWVDVDHALQALIASPG